MYDIALSVAACVRSGTRADVAWMVSPTVSDEALAFTPGGGRIGSLHGGAFDGLLADAAARQLSSGRLVTHTVTDYESQLSGIPAGTPAEFLVIPAEQIDPQAWPLLLEREVLAVTASREMSVDACCQMPRSTSLVPSVVSAMGKTPVLDQRRVTRVLGPRTRCEVARYGHSPGLLEPLPSASVRAIVRA